MQLTTMIEFTRTEHVHLSKEVKEANTDIMTLYMRSLRKDNYFINFITVQHRAALIHSGY